MVEFSLLGGLSLTASGQRLLPPARHKSLQLIVWLLLEAPTPLGRDIAASALAPGLGPHEARARLRVHLHAARQWLAKAGGRADWIVADPSAILLADDHEIDCDAIRFRRIARSVALEVGPRLADGALAEALNAVALINGPLLPGDDFGPFESHRQALAELNAALLAQLVRHHAALEDWASANEWARRLIHDQPDDSSTVGLAARVRLSGGDRKGALSLVRAFETRMGVDGLEDETLGPVLQAIAGATEPREVLTPAGAQPAPTEPAGTLRRRTSFVGRRSELAALAAAVSHSALVTVVGPGGTGKTRIATEVAQRFGDRFPDGVVEVDLGRVPFDSQVLSAAARALGVLPVPGQSLAAGVTVRLTGQHTLVVLDNCEHVPAGASSVAELMMAAAPGVRVLATSRVPLDLPSEAVFPLSPLSLPPEEEADGPRLGAALNFEAPVLFCERASISTARLSSDVRLAEDVVAICRNLDGIPLAIELAASWTGFLDLPTIAANVRQLALDVGDGNVSRSDRQRTLATTIEWSYRLLPVPLQDLFRRLSVFASPFGPSDARAFLATQGEPPTTTAQARSALDRLTENSILVPVHRPNASTGYGFLQVIRDFAAARLALDADRDVWSDVHAARIAVIARRSGSLLRGARRTHFEARIADRHPDLVAALSWLHQRGDPERALSIIGDLWAYWPSPRAVIEARDLIEPFVTAMKASSPPALRARVHLALGGVVASQGDYARSRAELATAHDAFAVAGDDEGRATCLSHLSRIATNLGQHSEARRYGRSALRLCRQRDDRHGEAVTLQSLAESYARQHDLDRAMRLYRRCLRAFRQLRDRGGMANALIGMALVSMKQADLQVAQAQAERALALRKRSGSEAGMAGAMSILGGIATARGDLDGAQRAYESSLARYRKEGHVAGITVVLHNLGDVAWSRGDVEQAADYFQQAVAMPDQSAQMRAWLPYRLAEVCMARGEFAQAADHVRAAKENARATHFNDVEAEACRLDARLAALRGEPTIALARIRESLAIWRRSGGIEGALRAFDTLAELLLLDGQTAPAATTIFAIDHVRQERSSARALPEQWIIDRCLRTVRATLDTAALRESERAGRELGLERLWSLIDNVSAS